MSVCFRNWRHSMTSCAFTRGESNSGRESDFGTTPWQSTAARAHVSYSYQPGNSSDAPSTLHGTNASRSHDSPMTETESLNKNIFWKIIPVKSFVKRNLSVLTWRMSCGLGWRGGRFSLHVTGFRSSYWQMTEAHIRPVQTTHFVSDDSLFLSISYYS